MPRRRPSFVPLLFVAVLLTLVTAVRQSVAVEPPPDVPDATLALDDSQKPEPQEIVVPPATLSSLSPMMPRPDIAPDMVSGGMFSPGMAAADHDQVPGNGNTRVQAPTTQVEVDRSGTGTRTRVEAPSTNVDVNTQRGRVRIRVPYFSRDIRW